jgi:N-acetylneuraminic acid mutarotase
MFKRFATLGALMFCLLGACGGGGGGGPEPAPPVAPPPLPAGWTRLADMPAGVAKFGVAALGNRIHVVGGYDTRRTVMVYDIAANSWSAGPALPRGTDNVAALATDTHLYALGGEAGTAMQIFDPTTQAWASGPALPVLRFASAAAVLGQRLHIVGGWNANNAASASLASQSIFDLGTQAWSAAAALATPRNAAAAAVLDGRLHVVGGRSPGIRAGDQQSLASMEIYNPATDQWAAGAALPTARGSLAAVALAGRLYALGGESTAGTVSNAVERYDPATGTWTALAAMPYRSHGLGAVVVGGAIYVMGGFTGASDAVGTESVALYRYQPAD